LFLHRRLHSRSLCMNNPPRRRRLTHSPLFSRLAECPRITGMKGAIGFALLPLSVQQIPILHQIRQNCQACALGQDSCRRKPEVPFDAEPFLASTMMSLRVRAKRVMATA
jgi:hypothetical protein